MPVIRMFLDWRTTHWRGQSACIAKFWCRRAARVSGLPPNSSAGNSRECSSDSPDGDSLRRIFLDVGGFKGDSARAALDPKFGFDRVYCFEPVRACQKRILEIVNPRLTLIPAGLLDIAGRKTVFNAGTLGGSVYPDAPSIEGGMVEEACDFMDAGGFFRQHIKETDRVWMKLNCEGAEVAILENLVRSGEARKLHNVLIDFDAAKIPSLSERLRGVRAMLAGVSFAYLLPEQVQHGMINNYGAIRNWLIVSGASAGWMATLKSLRYQTSFVLDREFNGYYKMMILRAVPSLEPLVKAVKRWRDTPET
jgi:FkbM family methyltransferase